MALIVDGVVQSASDYEWDFQQAPALWDASTLPFQSMIP
jgi:hypothetical protein